MSFAECGNCGCPLDGGDLLSQQPRSSKAVQLDFMCHCDAMTMVVVELPLFVEFIADESLAFRAILNETPTDEMFEFWEEQALIHPEAIHSEG